ncbi:protein jag [Brachybacterium sp. GCM10030267]|uniref:Jag family protein n=1 Tax=Brachybacterium sp. GCM10030267 TaxID=3273381 RepID=UPI0036217335
MNDTTPDVPTAGEADDRPVTAPEQSAASEASARSAPEPAAESGHAGQSGPEVARPAESADEEDRGASGDLEDGGEDEADPTESSQERLRRLEEEGDIAADYLEELLDIADLDGDIDIDVDGDRASVEIRGAHQLEKVNRPKGEVLDALQELARLAVQTRTGNRSRLMLDIGGFRAEHKDSLEDLAAQAAAEAKETGAPVPMRPMNPFERKVVHDVAKREGLRSESDGDGKSRHVVIYPGS